MRSELLMVVALLFAADVSAAGAKRGDSSNVEIAQKDSPICDPLFAAIEDGVKELSYLECQGWSDDSAPRETNRKLRQSVILSSIQVNLSLLQWNKCASPKFPVIMHAYRSDALACSYWESKPRSSLNRKELNQICDRANWVRDKDRPSPSEHRLFSVAKTALGPYFDDPSSVAYGKVTLAVRSGEAKRYICGTFSGAVVGGANLGFQKFYVELAADDTVSKIWREGESTRSKREFGDRAARDEANIANAREKEAASEKCDPSDQVKVEVLKY